MNYEPILRGLSILDKLEPKTSMLYQLDNEKLTKEHWTINGNNSCHFCWFNLCYSIWCY